MENNFQLFSGDLGPWGDGLVWVRQTQPRQVGCFYEENRKSILFLVLAFPPLLEKSRLWRSFQSSCQDETFHDEKLHSNWAKKIVEDDKVIPKHFRIGHLNFILINMFLIRMGDFFLTIRMDHFKGEYFDNLFLHYRPKGRWYPGHYQLK